MPVKLADACSKSASRSSYSRSIDASTSFDRLRTEVDRGRPVVALIEARPSVYHFVVVVGVTDAAIVLHDPARGPFQVMPRAEFDAAWAPAERWMLLVLPPADRPQARGAPLAPERAVDRPPQDRHAWQLLATSRYLTGDLTGALDAWNRIGEPRTNVVSVLGAVRTPHAIVVDLVDLPPREILTASGLRQAERRLEELPVASDASVRYEPIADGLATVQTTIDERDTFPGSWAGWGAMGFETLLQREVSLDVAGRLGAGENLRGRYRWARNRPRVMLEFGVPAPGPIPGIASVELSWERQAYGALVAGEPLLREERRVTADDVGNVRRACFLLTLEDELEIDRRLESRRLARPRRTGRRKAAFRL